MNTVSDQVEDQQTPITSAAPPHRRHDRSARPAHPANGAVSMVYSTKVELVYRDLRERIVNGLLHPGDHLYLQDIATALEVSTNPVREALRRLESEGLVTNRPHAGVTVAGIDPEKLETHCMIRGALEGLAIRLAADRMTPEALERLEEVHDELTRLATLQEFAQWNDCNILFHRMLFACSASPELVAMIDLQRDRSPRFRHFPEVLVQRARDGNEIRAALLAALRRKDGPAAEQLQRESVAKMSGQLRAAMAQREAASAGGVTAHEFAGSLHAHAGMA